MLRFAGELRDSDTGLYHLRARQYDPATGRFLTTDPLAPKLSEPYPSTYVYAGNRPTALVDPSGMGYAWSGESDRPEFCTSVVCWLASGNITATTCSFGFCYGVATDGDSLYLVGGCCGYRPGWALIWAEGDIDPSELGYSWSGCYYACVGGNQDPGTGEWESTFGVGTPSATFGKFKYVDIIP